MEKQKASAWRALPADLLELWPHVRLVQITFGLLPINWFLSTRTDSMKCVVTWNLLRIRVRSRNVQPHLKRTHVQPHLKRTHVQPHLKQTRTTNVQPHLEVGLGISRTNPGSQWISVYNAFHRIFCCGNETICR